MAATAQDYAWFGKDFPAEYCITLARGVTPEEFLTRIGAEVESFTRDADGLMHFSGHGDGLPIGATTVIGEDGPWTLGVEWNGYAGVTEEIMLPASAGTRIVSHFCNVNAHDRFLWYEDGETRLEFEPLFADSRWGAESEAIADEMVEAGFDLSDAEDRSIERVTEAAFALAERITGVRLTAEVLREAEYLCGVVRRP